MVSKASSQASMRKAAILVSALDHRTADALLDRMPADDAARVRNAVLDLGDVSDDEQRAVLAEFLQAGGPAGRGDEGVELDESLARKLAAAPERLSTSSTVAATPRQIHVVRLAATRSGRIDRPPSETRTPPDHRRCAGALAGQTVGGGRQATARATAEPTCCGALPIWMRPTRRYCTIWNANSNGGCPARSGQPASVPPV